MSPQVGERFGQLVRSLSLREIRPMDVRSQRLGDPPPSGGEVQIEWKQAYADDDPVEIAPDVRLFRPKYEFMLRHGGIEYFHQTSIFLLVFQVVDAAAYSELWADEELRKVFRERQLQHTMWPIFRQHALSGMSTVGLQAIPLPWLT
jgi:hypothetical protein